MNEKKDTKVISTIQDAAQFATFCTRLIDAATRALNEPIENINAAALTLMRVVEDEKPGGTNG